MNREFKSRYLLLVNAYLISSGLFGVLFIIVNILSQSLIISIQFILDIFFLSGYGLLLYSGIYGWKKRRLSNIGLILLVMQTLTFSIYGIEYFFCGIIDLFSIVQITPTFTLKFDLDTGIRFRLLFGGEKGILQVGINLVPALLLLMGTYNKDE